MVKFVDREWEMETLQEEYDRPGSSLVILYGRRRVGKTTLISEFIRDKKALFFLASEESETQNRKVFQDRAADFIGSDFLKKTETKDWDAIFRAIMEAGFDSKPILVIDEFQYIGKSNPAFPSVFQRIWEEVLKNKSVMVVLCGSLISLMEAQTLAYSSPLYGRRTAQIRLKPIPFRYYHEFFPERGRRELIESYSITGGIPKYIELFSEKGDIYQSIWKCVLNRSGYLYDEPYFLMQQEVTEIGSYFSIIKAIAAGNRKLSAISAVLEMKSAGLSKYLKTLMDLDILEREVPVTEENPEKSKKGLYKIKDPYLRFWFSFIYPNRSFIESGYTSTVMNIIQKSLVSGHTAFIYEDICRERMWYLNAEGRLPFRFSRIGRWWDGKDEIDLAAIDPEKNRLILGECKYWQNQAGINILRELEEKGKRVAWRQKERQVWYILFSAAGFTEELQRYAAEREDVLLCDEERNALTPF